MTDEDESNAKDEPRNNDIGLLGGGNGNSGKIDDTPRYSGEEYPE